VALALLLGLQDSHHQFVSRKEIDMLLGILNLLFVCLSGVVAILYRNCLQRDFERNPHKFLPTFRDVDFDTLYNDRLKKSISSEPNIKRG